MECNSTELVHYGVKGMKWGVRRKRSGPLSDKEVKKYAKKGYAQDSYRSNKTAGGKVWDRVTGAHKIQADIQYDTSSKQKNRERAEKYLADKERGSKNRAENAKRTMVRGAAKTAGALAKVGQAYVTDQVFFGGMGTDACKLAIKTIGMATITAYTMARGGYDIKWYDKQGRRVG